MFKKGLPLGLKIVFFSHLLLWTGTGLVGAIITILYKEELTGVGLTELGIGSVIFYLTVGVLEPFIGMLEDKIPGFKDETVLVILGYTLRGIAFILFAFLASNVYHLYLFQFVTGVSRAFFSASDKTVFSYFIPRKSVSTTWSMDDSVIYFSAALGGLLGGYYADMYGIRSVTAVAGVLFLMAGFIFSFVIKELKKNKIWKGF